jgi:hypothetical protein
VVDKFSDGRPEMPFAEKHHAVQALRLRRLDKPFGVRVQIGTPRRENQGRYAAVAQQRRKAAVYSGSASAQARDTTRSIFVRLPTRIL